MYIEKKKNTWYAVLTVPVELRETLGRLRFSKTTRTTDKAKARVAAAVMVAGWKSEIERARGTPSSPDAGYWDALRQDFLRAQAIEGDDDGAAVTAVMDAIEAVAKKITDPVKSSMRYRVAIGDATAPVSLAPLVADWKASLRLAQKTIDQQARDMTSPLKH